MCARKVQRVSPYSLDCELFVVLRSLKVGVLVAVVHCGDGAAAGCIIEDTLGLSSGGNVKAVDLVLLRFCSVL